MPAFFLYLLKANIALVLFYLAYRFGLRRLTFYTLNRAFLLFGIAFSAIYPSLDITAFFQRHQQLATRVIYYWQGLQSASRPEVFTIWNALSILFWAGVIIMSVRFMLQLISLLRFHRMSVAGTIEKKQVRMITGKINPFSFLSNIYVNPALHSSSELHTILQHELIHVKQWHTLDALAAEINIIFYWFNPGAWLMKNAIKENLEFIADEKVLKSGADASAYQYNLINTSAGLQAMSLANNFNFSHLKNRIIMMNKKRSSRINLAKYLLLLPVVIAVLIFTISDAQVPSQVVVKDTTIKSPAFHGIAVKSIDTSKPLDGKKDKEVIVNNVLVSHPLYIVDGKEVSSIKDITPNTIESINVLKGKDAMDAYGKKGKDGVIVITFKPHPLYIVDEKEVSSIKDIAPNTIESINVLKGKNATDAYGEKGKDGVIVVTLKKATDK